MVDLLIAVSNAARDERRYHRAQINNTHYEINVQQMKFDRMILSVKLFSAPGIPLVGERRKRGKLYFNAIFLCKLLSDFKENHN